MKPSDGGKCGKEMLTTERYVNDYVNVVAFLGKRYGDTSQQEVFLYG
jgi:hypothetical protein